ncbi:hypothetical protein L1987_70045 [Smallanthus sonchifolius]|uniref:Uncharacterized protein n=1 Tax=Smallanthus sonchifolius TaxID=185202 RepID=A0ACB9ANS8_9ASTR|nr:hypothetical protein L1987_70045 [Smallanthus sonchifolius]
MRPVGIEWPLNWGQSMDLDLENVAWFNVLKRTRERVKEQGNEEGLGSYQSIIQQLSQSPRERLRDPQEEAQNGLMLNVSFVSQKSLVTGKKKKKRKNKGKNPFKISNEKEGDCGGNGRGVINEEEARKRHKIWFSRNRRPEKNLSLKKVSFSQEAIPRNASINLMGLGEFKEGHVKTKGSQQKATPREGHMSRMDALFEDLMARKQKLKEIAANINATDENKMLLNSI